MLDKKIKQYLEYRKKIIAFKYVEWLIDWDEKTQAPLDSADFRANQIEILSKMYFDLRKNDEFLKTIDYLVKNIDKINDEILRKDIIKINRELRVIRMVPEEEYIEYQVLLIQSAKAWQVARREDNFNYYLPILQKVFDYNKKLIKYLETDKLKGYDVLLDLYEENTNVEFYDNFFNKLKEELIPFVIDVTKGSKIKFSKKLKFRNYEIAKQKEFSKYLIKTFDFDLKRGAIRDTIHAFSSGISTTDMRIATDYQIDNFIVSIFNVMHQIGDALYGQNNDEKFNGTFLFGAPSTGLLEAQARIYENMIGRSFAFWNRHYKYLVSLFPKELKGISVVEFYKFINLVKRSKIRIKADELTYPLHIIVRYEIEKDVFNGKLTVRNIARRWRSLMAKYVGVKPIGAIDGPLQDIHWAIGNFGHFPSYALGAAYAAQIYNYMNKEINVESVIENEHIHIINKWLKDNINKYGASKSVDEILMLVTKEKFNIKYYLSYLKNKFSKLK